MNKMNFSNSRRLTIAVACLLIANLSYSQTSLNAWTDIKENTLKENKTNRFIIPSKYEVMKLNVSTLKGKLKFAKLKKDAANADDVVIALPNPDGQFSDYRIYKNTTMSSALQAEYPEISTYNAVNINNNKEVAKIDITPQGFHAMIFSSSNGTIFIDPYTMGDTENYQIYYRKDYESFENRMCEFNEQISNTKFENINDKSFGTCELRTYRLALSCTGEYATAVGGSTAAAQSAMVTTMNRVNGVYEREIAITLTMIPNTSIIYTNGTTDPYDNNSAGILIGQSQSNINAQIGSASYDIGHTFSTGGGGLAGLGVVCNHSSKARGITGRTNPQGDPFDIDYVAHEMGHQFGATHTFNNSCSGNRTAATAYEPGSGSTIMGYAGICSPNVQNNSYDVFHGASLAQIGSLITSSATCSVESTPGNNSAPTITATNFDGNVTIPASTPFALTTTATDADGDVMTYTWDQMDNQITTQPPLGTATSGPNFRAINTSSNPTRYYPRLALMNNNGPYTWEKLPTVSRTMNFRTVVRDNSSPYGCNDHKDISVSVDGNSGPFVVTAPNNPGGWWVVGNAAQVKWDVAGTDAAPVSCDLVDIFLSTDNGATYPIQIADDVPNNGSWTVIVPNNPSNSAKVMVMCANGTFFNISNIPFRILAATGIDDLSSNNAIKTFYNNNKLDLTLTNVPHGGYNVTIVNALGQKIATENISIESNLEKKSIPFNTSANGIYYISISNDKVKYNTKFFKN